MLTVDPSLRLTAEGALAHEWINLRSTFLADKSLSDSQQRLRVFNARRKLKATMFTAILVAHA